MGLLQDGGGMYDAKQHSCECGRMITLAHGVIYGGERQAEALTRVSKAYSEARPRQPQQVARSSPPSGVSRGLRRETFCRPSIEGVANAPGVLCSCRRQPRRGGHKGQLAIRLQLQPRGDLLALAKAGRYGVRIRSRFRGNSSSVCRTLPGKGEEIA
jgi:hypothetical protein